MNWFDRLLLRLTFLLTFYVAVRIGYLNPARWWRALKKVVK